MDIAQKKYWRSLDELNNAPAFVEEASKEFAQEIPVEEYLNEESMGLEANRRDFLKIFGFSLTAATLAACTKTPVKKAVPFVAQPEEISPSVATWYATTYSDGYDYASILVKTREGRPIKVEGNNLSGISQGGVNARVHASVLSLYDANRLQQPSIDGKGVSWSDFDGQLTAKLTALAGKPLVLLTNSLISPTTNRLVEEFKVKYPTTRHVVYDAISASGILEANEADFGVAALPTYHFDQAKVILGIGADFLGNWISPVEYTRDYTKNRKVTKDNPRMSRHIQFESILTITGSNADLRVTHQASKEALVVANLYNAIAKLAGAAPVNAPKHELAGNAIGSAAAELWSARGQALVVCGSNDPKVQTLVNGINQLLDSYGNTIDMAAPVYLRQGKDADMEQLITDMNAGKIGALISYGVNPLYDYYKADSFRSGLSKVDVTVAVSEQNNETAQKAVFVAAASNFLESWGDAMPAAGKYSVSQPAISNLYDTRSFDEVLLALSGSTATAYDAMKTTWKSLASQAGAADFGTFWRTALHNGVYETAVVANQPVFRGNVNAAAAGINANGSDLELVVYEKLGIGNGVLAGNPWLQELPDPISKTCWDNYLAVSIRYARENGLNEGDIVKVSANGYEVEVPILIQPGTFPGTVALAVGYGRTHVSKAGMGIGANAYPFMSFNGTRSSVATQVSISKTGMSSPLAQTQTHHTIEGRNIVKETTLDQYAANPAAGNIRPYVQVRQEDGSFKKVYPGIDRNAITLWDQRDYEGHHWAMAIDLNACTGCGACIVSCQVENNVPVVGKQEVINRREMHWIRLDRYYAFQEDGARIDQEKEYAMITDGDNVQVAFQPVMCMQCDNAPCETVCPVLATVHSDEGLNQMVYNRCVGTRYCANNCPYKVRRFNWFSYTDNPKFYNSPVQTDLGKMVLNPDVTVRARGVMEKCTFCVQRIQAGKLDAKRQSRGLQDGEIKTACQQSCPSNAIIFGDLNDANSEVSKLFLNERAYGVIEELNVLPSVNYLTKVRNTPSNQA
jgi:MoCo/4Fe-4S cofactor protein with predicted Tat translocation signal